MAKRGLSWLKALWVTGFKPESTHYADLFDSFVNKEDDISNTAGIKRILAENQSTCYGYILPAGSSYLGISFLKVSGNPVVSVGTTLNGVDLVNNETITSSGEFYESKYSETQQPIYITVTGGAVTSNLEYYNRKYLPSQESAEIFQNPYTHPSTHPAGMITYTNPVDAAIETVEQGLNYAIANAGGGSATSEIRAVGGVLATGNEQTVTFSTPHSGVDYSLMINDYQGLGFQLIEKLATGFVCRFTESGVFDYVSIKNISASIDNTRASGSVIATGTEQTIAFSSPFANAQYALQILDYQGLGFELIEKTAAGFTCRFTESGLFEYIAIKNM